jgi:predicted nucleotidyltransferase
VNHPILVRRRAEQQARIRCAADWAHDLPKRLDLVAVVVFSSAARGDFNKWSDIDVLVAAERALPAIRLALALRRI